MSADAYQAAQARLSDALARGDRRDQHAAIADSRRLLTQGLRDAKRRREEAQAEAARERSRRPHWWPFGRRRHG